MSDDSRVNNIKGKHMFKKLGEEEHKQILESGIDVFAEHGFNRANINVIAKKAGVSVGVIYKYYGDKEKFFLACVRHSLLLLQQVLDEAVKEEADIMDSIHSVVCALIEHAKKHSNYNVMYHEITAGSSNKYAKLLAKEIETISASVYTKLFESAKRAGKVRKDCDCPAFAFFFDNLLMMLQFSYSCEYYKERFRIYCGEETVSDDEVMVCELMKFIKSALIG